jgi:hypothetical protein
VLAVLLVSTPFTAGGISQMPLMTIVIILLVLVLVGSLPVYPYSAGWGYYPAGGLGTILVVLLVLYLVGVI